LDGDANIRHKGIGTIETHGGNAIYARSISGDGSAWIDISGAQGKDSIFLHTLNDSEDNMLFQGHHGISASVNDFQSYGEVIIRTNAKILTEGKGSVGIYSLLQSLGVTRVENRGGTISTLGENAHAIYAMTDNVNATGRIEITNTGDLTSEGKGAKGIYSVHQGL